MLANLRVRRNVLIGLLCLFSLVNIAVMANSYGFTWIKRIQRTITQPALKRSAIFFLGSRGAGYLDFLSETIPTDAGMLLPGDALWFSSQNIMQFFLFPRSIVNCGCDAKAPQGDSGSACVHCIESSAYYIPAIGEFPPPAAVGSQMEFLPYAEDTGWYHGLYLPGAPARASRGESQQNDLHLIETTTLALLCSAAIAILGYALAGVFLDQSDRLGALSLGLPLGGGLLSWCLFILSWAGIRLSLRTVVLTWTLLLVGIGLVRTFQRDKNSNGSHRLTPSNSITSTRDRYLVVAWLGLGLLFLFAVVLSVGRAYSTYDAMAIWSLKGYAIAEAGTIYAGRDWGGHGMAYPLNLSLLIGIFKFLDGDVLPGSKLLFPLLAGSLLLGIYRYWRKQRVPSLIATLGLLSLLSIPLVFEHATLGFVNLPFTAYLVLGALWSVEGLATENRGALILGGLLLGYASWTRPEGIGFSAAILACLALLDTILHRRLHLFRPWLLPFVVIAGVWLSFGAHEMREAQLGHAVEAFQLQIQSGNFSFHGLGVIATYLLNQMLNLQHWGLIFPLLALLALASARRKGQIPGFQTLSTALLAVAIGLIPIGLLFVRSFSSPDLLTMLEINANRHFFPAVFLAMVAALPAVSTAGFRQTDPPLDTSSGLARS